MAEPAFLAWCQQHQIQNSRVQPGYVAEGWRGIMTTEPIDPDTVIMQVPAKLLMSVMSARREPQLARVLPRHQLNSHQILSIHLLHEAAKGSASLWHPYLLQLPRQFTTFITWPPAAVQALQVQYAQEAAAAAQNKAKSEWAAARPALQELGLPKKYLSWHAWSWAASCVLSRTMYHPDDPSCGCLTPLADLHNYEPPPPPHEVELTHAAEQLLQQSQLQRQQVQQQQRVQCAAEKDSNQQDLQPVGAADYQQQHQQQPEEDSADGLLYRSDFDADAQVQLAALGPEQVPKVAGTAQLLQHGDQNLKQNPQQQQQQQHSCNHQEQLLGQLAGLNFQHSPEYNARSNQQRCSADTTSIDKQHQLQQAATDASTFVNSSQDTHEATSAEGSNAAPAAGVVGAHVAEQSDNNTVSTICDNSSRDGDFSTSSSLCGDGQYDADEQVYKIVARRRYHPGDQVYLCYGRHTNLDLLELYGFLLEANPHDTALLSVDTIQHNMRLLMQQRKQQQEGEGRQWKRQPRQQQGPECEVDVCAADCWVSATGTPSWELTRALRLAAATPAELKNTSYLAHEGSPMSVGSEKLVLRCLLNSCEQTLAGLHTMVARHEVVLGNSTALNASENAANELYHGLGAEAAPSSATAAADFPKQSALQCGRECLQLAVRWRLCYEAALVKCSQQCEQALALLKVHELLPSGNNERAYGCREPRYERNLLQIVLVAPRRSRLRRAGNWIVRRADKEDSSHQQVGSMQAGEQAPGSHVVSPAVWSAGCSRGRDAAASEGTR